MQIPDASRWRGNGSGGRYAVRSPPCRRPRRSGLPRQSLLDDDLGRLDHRAPGLKALADEGAHLVRRAAQRLRLEAQDAVLEVLVAKTLSDGAGHLGGDL